MSERRIIPGPWGADQPQPLSPFRPAYASEIEGIPPPPQWEAKA